MRLSGALSGEPLRDVQPKHHLTVKEPPFSKERDRLRKRNERSHLLDYKLAGELAGMDTHLKAIRAENPKPQPKAEYIEEVEKGTMVTKSERLNSLIGTKAVLASNGLSTTEVDAQIAAIEREMAQEHESAALSEEYDFALDVEGATEKAIKDRASSEGPFVQPSAPGTYLGEIYGLKRDTETKPGTLIIQVQWRSLDPQEPACRGSLFCEMKDNAEWVLTRNVLGNLGIPYEIRGSRVLFRDFTLGGTEPFPAKAVWARASQGRANFRIESFLSAAAQSSESVM